MKRSNFPEGETKSYLELSSLSKVFEDHSLLCSLSFHLFIRFFVASQEFTIE